MQSKKDQYVQSFTIHGLTKIFTGTKIESIFWTCVVLCGVSISNFAIYGLISKYYRYEIYTEVHMQVVSENTFPSITFCDINLLKREYFAYCGVPYGSQHKDLNAICSSSPKISPGKNNTGKNNKWDTRLFHVKNCVTWGSTSCANDNYLKSLSKHNHSCFTWNWNGDLHDPYGHALIEFDVNKSEKREPRIVALVHDPRVTELDMTNRVIVEPLKTYEIRISKTFIKRLPHPFPSNCSDSKVNDIFPGKYTRRTCLESINYMNMLKHCGDVPDYHKAVIPNDILKKYKRNQSISSALKCFLDYTSTAVVGSTERCPVPCEEIELYTIPTFYELKEGGDRNTKGYRIHIQYQNVDGYKVFQEKQLYSWDQIAAEIGGFLGLVIGASLISIIEIIVYLILCMLHRIISPSELEKPLIAQNMNKDDSTV